MEVEHPLPDSILIRVACSPLYDFQVMAQIIENPAGFKVIEISRSELVGKLGHMGAVGICDYCSAAPTNGFYVAVLDQWYCPECYNRFIQENQPEPDDDWFENIRFAWFKKLFNL